MRAVLQDVTDWEICGEAIDGLDAIAKTRELDPDVIILDLAMPRMNGLETAREIRKLAPQIPILMFTTFLTPQVIEDARRVGIRGTVEKVYAGHSLVGGIRALLRKETFFPCSPTDLSATGNEQKPDRSYSGPEQIQSSFHSSGAKHTA